MRRRGMCANAQDRNFRKNFAGLSRGKVMIGCLKRGRGGQVRQRRSSARLDDPFRHCQGALAPMRSPVRHLPGHQDHTIAVDVVRAHGFPGSFVGGLQMRHQDLPDGPQRRVAHWRGVNDLAKIGMPAPPASVDDHVRRNFDGAQLRQHLGWQHSGGDQGADDLQRDRLLRVRAGLIAVRDVWPDVLQNIAGS